MPVDAKLVRIGTPDQLVTGAVLSAPLGTTLPDVTDVTKTGIELDEAFEDPSPPSSRPATSPSGAATWCAACSRRSPARSRGR